MLTSEKIQAKVKRYLLYAKDTWRVKRTKLCVSTVPSVSWQKTKSQVEDE